MRGEVHFGPALRPAAAALAVPNLAFFGVAFAAGRATVPVPLFAGGVCRAFLNAGAAEEVWAGACMHRSEP